MRPFYMSIYNICLDFNFLNDYHYILNSLLDLYLNVFINISVINLFFISKFYLFIAYIRYKVSLLIFFTFFFTYYKHFINNALLSFLTTFTIL
jgi:hypothetical protein